MKRDGKKKHKIHIKEKLDNENMEFLKTKPGKFGSTLMLDESKVSIV